jgi:hypothetical protein
MILIFFIINNFYVIVEFKENLLPTFSTGNINTRAIMFESTIDKFLFSPLYGNFFTKSPLIDFNLYAGRDLTNSGFVSIHNDMFEILSNGGIIFFILFLFAVMKPFYFRNNITEEFKDHFMTFYFSFILFLFCSLFNPLFSLPVLSFFGFFNFGLIYGIYYKSNEKY